MFMFILPFFSHTRSSSSKQTFSLQVNINMSLYLMLVVEIRLQDMRFFCLTHLQCIYAMCECHFYCYHKQKSKCHKEVMQQLQHQELEQTSNHESLILHASDVKPVSLFYIISFCFLVSKMYSPQDRITNQCNSIIRICLMKEVHYPLHSQPLSLN